MRRQYGFWNFINFEASLQIVHDIVLYIIRNGSETGFRLIQCPEYVVLEAVNVPFSMRFGTVQGRIHGCTGTIQVAPLWDNAILGIL